ncbi:MAG: DUF1638 domain-containing protein [Gammaproteobacteria bacterium]|nr:DUF1638 domain-containing protein [Gammaproteobacteria bacterium]MDH3465387.1 DUF1638 domain-containing protein [Gammaproteobacteria bacterium]
MAVRPSVLVIACGALAREIMALIRNNEWSEFVVQCLPAEFHNTPDKIPAAVRSKIREQRDRFEKIFVAYADCGTGGQLDTVLENEGVERLPGAHCYEFFAGHRQFQELATAEPGTFYLTDFLARHFERLIINGLGIDRHPELQAMYFGNYKKLVYLSQIEDADLMERAQRAARRLELIFEHRATGYGLLEGSLRSVRVSIDGEVDHRILA